MTKFRNQKRNQAVKSLGIECTLFQVGTLFRHRGSRVRTARAELPLPKCKKALRYKKTPTQGRESSRKQQQDAAMKYNHSCSQCLQ